MNPLRVIASVFFRIGLLGFGGPIALMALIQDEVVDRRKWLEKDHFTRIYALLKVMPGPLSTQMAIYVGRHLAGWRGGVVAGFSFAFPSVFIVLLLSVLYLHTPWVQQASGLFEGMQIGALALILLSTWELFKGHASHWQSWLIFVVSGGAVLLFPIWEPLIILGIGVIGILVTPTSPTDVGPTEGEKTSSAGISKLLAVAWVAPSFWLASGTALTLLQLFWVCFKAGAFVFGTGIAIVPILEAEVVGHFHWMTHHEFMDGLALGQVTPGPIVSSATFIGFKTAGFLGAFVATVAMFIPAFFNMLYLMPRLWSRFAGSRSADGFASYAIPAVIGGIFASMVRMWVLTLGGVPQFIYFVIVLGLSLWFRPPSWLVIPLAGVIWSLK